MPSSRIPETSGAPASMMPDGRPWPRISIVTPNFNYGHLIEATLRSVVEQRYPNLQFIVIDDGSTDDSVDVIRRFEPHLTHWETGPNRGHGAALSRGLAHCSGEIFNWICSDDQLAPGALHRVAQLWDAANPGIVSGAGEQRRLDTGATVLHRPVRPKSLRSFFTSSGVVAVQPSTFVSLDLVRRAGGIRADFRYLVDWDLYTRVVAMHGPSLSWTVTDDVLGVALVHGQSQTATLGPRIQQEYEQAVEALMAGSEDRRFLARQLENARARRDITSLLNNPQASATDVVRAGLSHPLFMATRFYAGALRRKLVS